MCSAAMITTRPAPTVSGAGAGQHAKVAIFGIDAADWLVIDPLVAAGHLPTFDRLKRVGTVGVMRADPPLLSPIIWTTIATGREPADHGVLDFMADTPGGGQAPVNGGARRVKAIWEMWSAANLNVLVTGWWATWPADRVRGLLVSDRLVTSHVRELQRPDAGLVFPASRWTKVAPMLVSPEAVDFAAISTLIPVTPREFSGALAAERQSASTLYQNPIAHFRAAVAATRSYRRVSTEFIRSVQPDLWATYYELVDTVSHLFIRDQARGAAAIRSAYVEMDASAGRRRQAPGPGDTRARDLGSWIPAGRCRHPRGSRRPHDRGDRLASSLRHRRRDDGGGACGNDGRRRGSPRLARSRRSTSCRRCWPMRASPSPATCRAASSPRLRATRPEVRSESPRMGRTTSRVTTSRKARPGRRRNWSGCGRSATLPVDRPARWPVSISARSSFARGMPAGPNASSRRSCASIR